MSNEIFETLYKQYENMIKVFIRKYKGLIEEDEIRQACLIAIVKAHNSYNSDTNMKLSNWVYQNMQWEVYREIRNTKHLTKNCISLQTPLNSSEDDNITLEDTLQDDIDVEAEIEDEIMMQTYKDEILANLDNKKANVMILKFFEGMSGSYIEKTLNITGVSNYVREARMTLIRKSKLFRAEYKRMHGISDYSTEKVALI